MIVYHGTISSCAENIIRNGIILKKGKQCVDFGQGFYTTISYEFAKSTAIRKTEKNNAYPSNNYVRPYVLQFLVNDDYLKSINILRFPQNDIKWAQFIINNRNGYSYMEKINYKFHNRGAKYDVVIGGIADNQIVLLAKELLSSGERITESELSNILYLYPTSQMSFHTKKSLSCIKLTNCDIIKTRNMKGDVVNE